jgi:hypothetical protein
MILLRRSDETFTITSGTASATGTITDNDAVPTVASITAATAAEGKPCSVQLYAEQPSAVDTTHTFVID